MSRTDVAAAFTEITDDDVEDVVALWHACGLTRPWNDPHVDIADARSGPTSTILVVRDDPSAFSEGGVPDRRFSDGSRPTGRPANARGSASALAPAETGGSAKAGSSTNVGETSAGISGPAGASGRVVASVMAGLDGHRGWLYYVAVSPDRQGGGLGRAAVAAGEAWLRAAGARKVQLMVRTTNSAVLDFYERLGYSDQETTVLGRWF